MYKKLLALLLTMGTVLAVSAGCGSDKENIEEQTGSQTEQMETEVIPEVQTFPNFEILSEVEDDVWVNVETTYGAFRYPAAFSDIMKISASTNENGAQMQVLLSTGKEDLVAYTLYYNEENDTAITCGKLKLNEEMNEMNVSVVFEGAPESLSADWLTTFYAVQETFNDVIFSLAEDSRFTAVN